MSRRKLSERVPLLTPMKAVELRLFQGLTWETIATKLKVSQMTVYKTLKSFKYLYERLDGKNLEAFATRKSTVLTAVEQELLLRMMDEKKLNKASLNQIAYSYQVAHQANRLEQGKPTVIDITMVSTDIEKNERRIAELKERLRTIEGSCVVEGEVREGEGGTLRSET